MKNAVYDYFDYIQYLKDLAGPEGTRSGVRLAMAEAMGCHSSYLTKVFLGTADLSLEQAFKLQEHLGLGTDEAEYFLLLVEKSRAGTAPLKRYFESKLETLRQNRLALKQRVPIKKTLSRDDQAIYYGSWHYAALHIALTIPHLRTRSALAKYFDLPEIKVTQFLQFLVSVGLVIEKQGSYYPGQSKLHLEGDSPNIFKHHTNWRTQAILSLDSGNPTNLHYSGVFSLSRNDAEQLRERLIKTIQESISFATESKNEENVLCFGLDLFNLQR